MKFIRSSVVPALLFGSVVVSAHGAETCIDNFTVEGSFFSGKVYKTSASVEGVRTDEVFARVARFTAENGFTVATADKQLGLISASQSVTASQGKSVPLSISVHPEGPATRIALTYATSTGVMSPEDAIKRHFCMTVAAAGGKAAAGAASAETAPRSPRIVESSAIEARPSTMRGFATANPAQQRAIDAELSKAKTDAKLRALLAEAAPAVKQLTERLACLSETDGAMALNDLAAPERRLSDFYMAMRPMKSTRYHDKSTCMTVVRIHGWQVPALNALKYEVVYRADDSGETAKTNHEAVRQPDGTWLFNH